MTYGSDHEILLHRSKKRRRLLFGSKMARPGHEEPQGHTVQKVNPASNRTCENPTPFDDGVFHTQREIRTSDREELIEYIKRGQKPTWVPKPTLKALCAEEDALVKTNKSSLIQHTPPIPEPADVYQMHEEPFFGSWTDLPKPQARWAPHAGVFTDSERLDSTSFSRANTDPFLDGPVAPPSASPPWFEHTQDTIINHRTPDAKLNRELSIAGVHRRRAPSLGSSLSSSFVMRTPTSPLVHAVSNPGIENSSNNTLPSDLTNTERLMRRRTMPPNSYQSSRLSLTDIAAQDSDQTPSYSSLRREATMPYYTHQPRRSLSSFTYQSSNSPQTPHLRARRLSLASDSSPKQRTSMVGSFEESILRGRMSSPASKPFDFVAQIGVMGKGNCPSSLKCPAHVTVSFQAVFYSYPTSNYARTIADDTPSPYVGTIDLEHGLKPIYLTAKRKHNGTSKDEASLPNPDSTASENTHIGRALERDSRKLKRRSSSPRMILGGAYRVPQKGQLQIIVKNPNKTAVKLFLVPYDLEGMETGTKTFIRQRSYSSGVIVENALGNAKMESSSVHDPLKDKDILRYLIHLKFCCPAKGRYYLHDNIRVVFANRVPDSKEKLRNELQLPEPRYSTYRPVKISQSSNRSSFADLFSSNARLNSSSDIPDETSCMKNSSPGIIAEELPDLIDTLPFHHGPRLGHTSAGLSQEAIVSGTKSTHHAHLPSPPPRSPNPEQALSPIQGFLPSTSTRSSPVPWGSSSTSSTNRSFSPVPVEAGDGLLSRQFRNLTGNPNDP